MSESKSSGGIAGPLILLAIGVVFLLNNLGLTEIDLWGMLIQLWPLLLIALGVDLLLSRRSRWATFVSVLLIAGIFLGGFALYQSTPDLGRSAFSLQTPFSQAELVEVELNPPIGILRVSQSEDPERLVSGYVGGWPVDQIQAQLETRGSTTRYSLGSGSTKASFPWLYPGKTPVWEVGLTGSAPLDLEVDFGVGDACLELGGLQLAGLNVDLAVGRMEVTLPLHGSYQVSLDVGVGLLILNVPANSNLKIIADRGLAGIQVPRGYEQSGETYFSPEYSRTSPGIEVAVSLGVGNIQIREFEP